MSNLILVSRLTDFGINPWRALGIDRLEDLRAYSTPVAYVASYEDRDLVGVWTYYVTCKVGERPRLDYYDSIGV